MDAGTLIFSTLFGAIGAGYIIYGMKQKKGIPLLSGVLMSVFPFFVSNILLVIVIGAVLMYLPKLIES